MKKCWEVGMHESGEDAVSVRWVELPAGLLHLLPWLRSIETLTSQKRLLMGLSWSSGSLALLLLFCAISMDSWLFTVEREPHEVSNATFLVTLHSGLWRVCKKFQFMKDVGKNTQWNLSWLVHDYHFKNCSYIPHFQHRSKESGELKPTESIIYSMRPAAFFPLAGLLILCSGGGCGLAACWGRRRSRRLLFLSGGAFIVSGILTLIGIVLYVGSVSLAFDSISGPLRVETRYVYSFGTAFRLCIGGFVLCEFSGVFVVHLFLAELRHRQKPINKGRTLGNNKMNSVSTDLSLSRIPTATTPVAQISLTENCLDNANSGDTLFLSVNRRPMVPKSNHFSTSSRIANPLYVKAVPYTKCPEPRIKVAEVFAHSLESFEPDEDNQNCNLEETSPWPPVKSRRILEPTVGSMNNFQSIGQLRRGNARSAVNIRPKEIPNFIHHPKSTRGSKRMFYYSCRECEQTVKQQQLNSPTVTSERSSSTLHQIATSENTSSTSSDSITSSLSSSHSSYTEIENQLSSKLSCDPSPRRLPRSPCQRQGGAASHQKHSVGICNSKTLPLVNSQRSGGQITSESENRESELSPAAVCRCPDNCPASETLLSLSEALARSSSSTLSAPLHRPKKRAKPYNQVTAI